MTRPSSTPSAGRSGRRCRRWKPGLKPASANFGQFAERIVGNMAWGEFFHFTARPVKGEIDPHLHAHCFVPNLCWDHVELRLEGHRRRQRQGRCRALESAVPAAFRPSARRAGLCRAWDGDDFEIAGIDRGMIDRFSRRTHHINQTAEKRGITDAKDKDKLGALTRERKQKDATLPQLRAEWRERLTDDDRAAIAQAARNGGGRCRVSAAPGRTGTLP